MCVYGDPAYPLRAHLQGPYSRAVFTLATSTRIQQIYEQCLVSVEWIFNNIINCFKFLDFKKNLKVGLR